MENPQLDLFGGEKLRDAGIAQVTDNNLTWMEKSILMFDQWATGNRDKRIIGEDIRVALAAKGLEPPKHHNAWGALISHLVRTKRLSETGFIRKMKDPQSHARRSPEYFVV
jgi:hypothetical protein